MTPTVRHGIDPTAGMEYLVTDWVDGLPLQMTHRPMSRLA